MSTFTRKCFYDLKIAETNKRIQRLEEQNKELENNLEDTNRFIQILQEEKTHEISGLNSQIVFQVARVEEYKKQLITLDKSRVDNESAHIVKIMKINEEYKNIRLILTSKIKFLSAKTNILENYKSMQHILEKKLNTQDQALIREKEQMTENLYQIRRKFKIDKEKLKKDLYNCLLELAGVFQLEIIRYMPRSISRLLSENITINNILSTIAEDVTLKQGVYSQRKNAVKERKRKINNTYLNTERSIMVAKLEKFTSALLREIRNKTDSNLSKQNEFNHLTEEQYIINKDNAKNKAQKCESRVKYLEILLHCEKEKLAIAENQKQWISDQLQIYSQMLYDAQCVLTNFKTTI